MPPTKNRVAIVVVENHNHALEHIHSVLRRILSIRSRSNKNNITTAGLSWSLVNFDSHPDMACMKSPIPASAAFHPQRPIGKPELSSSGDEGEFIESSNLYEMLDLSESGIAEWILPLVMAADLKTVYWIQSSWAHQFTAGRYDFFVGAWDPSHIIKNSSTHLDLPDDAVLKVSLPHPYYLEDSSVVPEDELELKQKLCFIVSQKMPEPTLGSNQNDELWCLSIDLDYFSCLNPFICELESIDKKFTESLLKAAQDTRFRKNAAKLFSSTIDCDRYEQEYHQFIYLVTLFFQNLSNHNWHEYATSSTSEDDFFPIIDMHQLSNMYEKPEYGSQIWMDMIQYLVQLPGYKISKQCRENVSSTVLRALPCLFIPHYPEIDADFQLAQQRIQFMGDSIRTSKFSSRPPFMVVVSRSTVDGFTPESLVERLETMVLQELHTIYCTCSREFHGKNRFSHNCKDTCFCYIVLDYGDYEGSLIDTSRIEL